MIRTSRRFGWKPDLPDHRDFRFRGSEPVLANLPPSVDLRNSSPGLPPVYDQGDLGSCTANAIAGAIQYGLMKQGGAVITPSRLFIYYNERVIENAVNSDDGAYLRDGLNSVSQQGTCSEDEWPYNVSEFNQKPYQSCYTDAMEDVVSSYYSLNQNIYQMKSCLAEGFPFIFGFTAYESIDNVGPDGVVPVPGDDESVIGGHCVLAVGYDDQNSWFIIRNSWGPNWGDAGYGKMPYSYLLNANLADDFWTIRMVSDESQN
jgi:C1A family cysteine protease